MKINISSDVKRAVSKGLFKIKKNSPTILVVAGVAGAVASTVLACKATLKVNDILEETQLTMDIIHKASNDPELKEKYSEQDVRKDLAITYVNAGMKFAKLYAPAVLLGAASIGCIVGSHHILSKRNAALTAAYTVISNGYSKYRSRVVDRFGERVDYELKHGIKAQKIQQIETTEEGKAKKVNKTVDVMTDSDYQASEYGRFFDEGSSYFTKDAEHNLRFLKQTERWCNDKLKDAGYLFLNDVYDALDIPRSQAGQVVGWTYNPESPNGDNYVDFGLTNLYYSGTRDFVNGIEPRILLDFNVDGVIIDIL